MWSLFATPAMAVLSLVMSVAGGAPEVVRAPKSLALRSPGRGVVPEVPTSLLDVLAEGNDLAGHCHPVEVPRWHHEAEECSYEASGRKWTLSTATPSAERVARWIVDASSLIPSVDALRDRDHRAWEEALVVMGKHTIAQSGRVFPLDGVVWEDFEGATGYVFHDGVTYGTFGGPLATCRACACRIDSLSRPMWCAYQADVLGVGTRASCLEALGGESGWNDAWSERCLENHDEAWNSDRNESYRAIAYFIDRHQMRPLFPDPREADPSEVVTALGRAYLRPYAITRSSY